MLDTAIGTKTTVMNKINKIFLISFLDFLVNVIY